MKTEKYSIFPLPPKKRNPLTMNEFRSCMILCYFIIYDSLQLLQNQ